jgi:hypothetical protein
MVRFHFYSLLKPHHSFVYAVYMYICIHIYIYIYIHHDSNNRRPRKRVISCRSKIFFCEIGAFAGPFDKCHWPLWNKGPDIVVGTATRYELHGPGIESRWGWDFQHPFRPALGPTQPPVQLGTGSFPGVKRSGRGVDHQPPSSAEVKERVELYLCSQFVPSWPVLGWTLPFPLK